MRAPGAGMLLALALAGCAGHPAEGAPPISPVPPTLTGLSAAACTSSLHSGTLRVSAGGSARTADVRLPRTGARTPLVIAFHGFDQKVASFDSYSKLRAAGATLSLAVVEPQGLGSPAGWNVPNDPTLGPSDVTLTRALINRMVRSGCVDPGRVFLAGLSDGADMAVTAACSLGRGHVAGVLLVAASTGPAPRCSATDVLQVHGTADPIDAYTGRGTDTRRGFGSVKAASAERAFAMWSSLAGCSGRTDATRADLRILTGTHCRVGMVRLIAVQGGGHTWPGASPRPGLGRTTMSTNTIKLLRELIGGVSG